MVGQYCCVNGCYSRSHSRSGSKNENGIRFFAFPKWKRKEGQQTEDVTKRRRMAWVAAVRRKNITFENIPAAMKVCSRHFHSGQPAYEMLETHPDWSPSLYMGHNEVKVTDYKRFARQAKRKQQGCEQERTHVEVAQPMAVEWVEPKTEEVAQPMAVELVQPVAVEVVQPKTEEVAQPVAVELVQPKTEEVAQPLVVELVQPKTEEVAQPVLVQLVQPKIEDWEEEQVQRKTEEHHHITKVGECGMCKLRYNEISRLLEENRQLKRALDERKMTEQFLKDDSDKVKYYTGLQSYATFMALLTRVLPSLPQGRRILTPFQMLLLTLMRLRLDLPIQHLAHLFDVHRTTVTSSFKDTLDVLYTQLSPMVYWPDRDSLRASMPHQFVESFGNHVVVIVDCFKVHIGRPSSLQAQPQTQKYVVCITPQGEIAFISKGWGGCSSDKHIIENSGLLHKLLPGDMVLADSGFDIKESIGMMCAEVKIPTLAEGQFQLDAKDVEETRKIAHLKTHIQRIIGSVRNKYKVLAKTVPAGMILPCEGEGVPFLDKVVTVCFALTNMNPSVV